MILGHLILELTTEVEKELIAVGKAGACFQAGQIVL